ncbi:bifunctional helix-turn-helix transcriptional regulator/GNAT family N-acetyltransferase [Alicyclobacillus dauci]|uniref:Bifunctional helix-turn-helix transcriptional regulator/GNAT family N-acetyltransferase n=1 Tax=Alicyclobacillus dauci TaxID=1475485 RepID=A0ABY6Z642_9BACL|nr:bifunctional helix-turn-helix transcriptional regulator/GNAT family N-acetyltransferase [Alicyclobacillus dauci]WAH38359.1 bifunctional helix-turn-helix transcriptional regulator/GNAT family N-acetyltransferase [Alicyclobacillus dauci]
MSNLNFEDRITIVRQFNRFFTRHLGVLRDGLLHSPYSLTESRIIYEIANRDNLIAADLSKELGLDAGYLSRILDRLEQQELIQKVSSGTDARQRILRLTPNGKQAFSILDSRSREEISELLNNLSDQDQNRLIQSMNTIEHLLGEGLKYSEPYFLRQHEPGDMGWVVHMHGRLYAEEYGWDEHFEALVAQICSDFINNFNPDKERCWIAEMDGQVVGSVFVVQSSETVAKLRLLLVDPKARGLGLGRRLVDLCIRFAKRKGYKKLVLWTNDVLVTARNIYQKAGFKLIEKEPHHSFGHDLVGETWELSL